MPSISPLSSAAPLIVAPVEIPPAVSDKLAALSADEPLPEAYQVDRIRLLAQSPRKLHLYWELARDPFETLRRAFGPDAAARYRLAVRLVNSNTGEETWHEASARRAQWFDARPDMAYRAELGLLSRGRGFIRLLTSSIARTPRAGVARRADPAPQFNVSAESFARVLDDAGYAGDALEVSLEAADAATAGGASRAVAHQLAGSPLPPLDEDDIAQLRGMLAAVTFGAPAEEVRIELPPVLARWLEAARRERPDLFDSARLLAALHETLGLELSRTVMGALGDDARRRAPRAMPGASDVHLPLRLFHLWLPSLTAGALGRMRDEG